MPSWAERKDLGHNPSLANTKAQDFNCWFGSQDREQMAMQLRGNSPLLRTCNTVQEASRDPGGVQDKAGPLLLKETLRRTFGPGGRGGLGPYGFTLFLYRWILRFSASGVGGGFQ